MGAAVSVGGVWVAVPVTVGVRVGVAMVGKGVTDDRAKSRVGVWVAVGSFLGAVGVCVASTVTSVGDTAANVVSVTRAVTDKDTDGDACDPPIIELTNKTIPITIIMTPSAIENVSARVFEGSFRGQSRIRPVCWALKIAFCISLAD